MIAQEAVALLAKIADPGAPMRERAMNIAQLQAELHRLYAGQIRQVQALEMLNFIPPQNTVPKDQQKRVADLRDQLRRIGGGRQ